MFNFNKLVPATTEDRLIWLGQFVSDASWEIADITINLISELELLQDRIIRISQYLAFEHKKVPPTFDEIMRLGVMDVYQHVADITGFSSRTIRDYVRLGKHYSMDMREQYDVLSFSFFRFAAQYPGKEEDIFKLALRLMDANGGKLSLDLLEAKVMAGPLDQSLQEENQFLDLQEQLYDNWTEERPTSEFQPVEEVMVEPDHSRKDRIILKQLGSVLEFVASRIQKLDLKEEHRERIAKALWAILETLREVESEVAA